MYVPINDTIPTYISTVFKRSRFRFTRARAPARHLRAISARCAENDWFCARRRRQRHQRQKKSWQCMYHYHHGSTNGGVSSALATQGPPPLRSTSDTGVQLAGEQIRDWCNNERTVGWLSNDLFIRINLFHSNRLILSPQYQTTWGMRQFFGQLRQQEFPWGQGDV